MYYTQFNKRKGRKKKSRSILKWQKIFCPPLLASTLGSRLSLFLIQLLACSMAAQQGDVGLQEAREVLMKTRGTLACPGNNGQRLLGGFCTALHSHCYSCHLLWAILRVCKLRMAMVLFSNVSCFAWLQLHLMYLSIRLNCNSEKARVRSPFLAWMSRIQQPLQTTYF